MSGPECHFGNILCNTFEDVVKTERRLKHLESESEANMTDSRKHTNVICLVDFIYVWVCIRPRIYYLPVLR